MADGDDLNDDFLAVIDNEEEAERPTRTSSGRSIIWRSENDFVSVLLILFKTCG